MTFVGGACRACALNRSKQLPQLQPLASLSRMASDLAVDRATPSPDQSRYIHVTSTRWRACCYIHVESDTSLYMFSFCSIASTVRERVFAKLLQKQVQWEPSTLYLNKTTVSAVYISMELWFFSMKIMYTTSCTYMFNEHVYVRHFKVTTKMRTPLY